LTITPGINNDKRPQIKSVADAVERTVESGDSDIVDDDISRWLLEPAQPSQAATETQTLSMDDTNAIHAQMTSEEDPSDQADVLATELVHAKNSADEEKSSGKKKSKKEPGKLPPSATGPATKDSRDAASAALRNWNRRS